MEVTSVLKAFSDLGPPTAAVLIIGLICWKLLQLFDQHSKALASIQENMRANTDMMLRLADNLSSNTRATENMAGLLNTIECLRSHSQFQNVKKRT